MSEHSRLDYILSAVENDADYPMSIQLARAELSAMRHRIAELEASRAELAALRSRVSELESSVENQADSLRHWADLWAHIATRFGEYEALPNEANFDAMLAAQAATLTPRKCEHCNPLKPSRPVDDGNKQECGDCKYFERCVKIFGCKAHYTQCDWIPSRFERK